MALTEPIKATVVQTTVSGKVSLREGEEVEVLELLQDPESRWQVRVAGREGGEAMLRPCLLGQCRKPGMHRLTNLTDAELMVEELNFWHRLWKPVSPRKAAAMERMAYWVSSTFQAQETDIPFSVLHNAWTHYRKERRNI
ncbi:MAG: hypothetical protein ACE5JS_12540 [Nitrospinota bacterium]